MSRAAHKQTSVAEQILVLLMSGRTITMDEIMITLAGKIVPQRIPTYMWELKKRGAVITRSKVGAKINGYTLSNPETMRQYILTRNAAGANIPVAVVEKDAVVEAPVVQEQTQELVTA
jgi:hypothetical protein